MTLLLIIIGPSIGYAATTAVLRLRTKMQYRQIKLEIELAQQQLRRRTI